LRKKPAFIEIVDLIHQQVNHFIEGKGIQLAFPNKSCTFVKSDWYFNKPHLDFKPEI